MESERRSTKSSAGIILRFGISINQIYPIIDYILLFSHSFYTLKTHHHGFNLERRNHWPRAMPGSDIQIGVWRVVVASGVLHDAWNQVDGCSSSDTNHITSSYRKRWWLFNVRKISALLLHINTLSQSIPYNLYCHLFLGTNFI